MLFRCNLTGECHWGGNGSIRSVNRCAAIDQEAARREGDRIRRGWDAVAWVAFQIRTPVELKNELVAYARRTGQSQQAVVTQALEAFLHQEQVAAPEEHAQCRGSLET